MHAPDAIFERRMRIEKAAEPDLDALSEEHVRHVLGAAVGYEGSRHTDPVERTGDSIGIAGELHGRGVGEKFALPRYRRLDDAGEEKAHPADDEKGEAHREDAGRCPVLLASTFGDRAHDEAADRADEQDTRKDADHPDVEPHVAIQDVAELVADHALQLVARERL